MGLFDTINENIVKEVELATNENNSEENWYQIIAICDKAGKTPEDAKSYLKTIIKRLYNTDPHIAIQAVTLLDACVKNSGKTFHIEVASREFETDFMKLMSKAHPKVAKKLRESLKKWSENEFKNDPQLNLIPSLYMQLKNQGYDFSTDMPVKKSAAASKDPNVVESQEEEEQILKAIELSLKETTSSPRSTTNTSLYPSTNLSASGTTGSMNSTPVKEPKKVRALYDFEAVEDNELTFNAGEIIFVLDDSDPNWWKGSNQRGEGLFPSNFVTQDLSVEPEKFLYEKAKQIVQAKETTDNGKAVDKEPDQVEIDEVKIDRLLHLLHEADPTNPETDTEEMLKLEREVNSMGPLIDSELERVDRKHAQLTQLSADLVEALSLYHTLMREPQYPPINNKIPYRFNDMTTAQQQQQPQPPPSTSMNFNNPQLPPQAAGIPPPLPPNFIPPPPMPQHYPQHFPMMPPSHLPPNHLPPGTLPPPNMIPTDDRRMPIYGPQMFPSNFPPNGGVIGSQTMLHNGPPQSQQQQQFMPTSNMNQK